MGKPFAGCWRRSGDDHGATRGPGAGPAGAEFDFRRTALDSLAALVQVTLLRLDPFAGDVFVYALAPLVGPGEAAPL